MPSNRPIRIASCSGSASDRRHGMYSLASNYQNDPVEVIMGDWMSEANMTSRAWTKTFNDGDSYEPTFLESLVPSLLLIAKHKIKVITNAGATDTQKLYHVVGDLVRKQSLDLKVCWVSGDEVLSQVLELQQSGESSFKNVYTGEALQDWKFKPIYAQAYLGGMGISTALQHGADIVICGRVSDASPVIGAAHWWHSWNRSDLKFLANAFVAGHLIECSTYITGGNFTGFRSFEKSGWEDIGFPIAEISKTGEVIITKQKNTGGLVSRDTCTSQLLYEIQGPWYFNSDVTAILDGIWFEELDKDRVALHGVKGDLPPSTTKVGITADGGYQAEFHWFLVGLNIEDKARMIETQIRKILAPQSKDFTLLHFQTYGSAAENPINQPSATVDLRIFVQARKEASLSPQNFLRPCLDVIMQAYPGATPHLDFRQGFPKQVFEYYVTLLPQSAVDHKVHLHTGEVIRIPPPPKSKTWPHTQPSTPTTQFPILLDSFGPTETAPLGTLVHARSGDKGSDANVGFWVRSDEEFEWLRTLLSVDTIKKLLADEYNGKEIDRFELPKARAVHFLLHDHLDRGVSCTSSYDFLGKNVAEFLRARHVEIPVKFLYQPKL
ncbi:DUF1446 domain-containing protein [Microthyrium microscopicum]|uniref:DUF1446 domain-containing protein n=1 Tax=Microthyrium microscopicum TaxID=703497 RepID=A0A6A6U9H2_9PEZI|nr:DUF1446 domain-containing protein [Microthyrium microscopicum]